MRLAVFLAFVCLALTNCSHRDPEAERGAAVAEVFAKLHSCAPQNEASEPEGNLKLAIASIELKPNETSVRLVAYAPDEPANFDLPVYSLSSGRWLINEKGEKGEKGRAYLLDQQCREYKLKGRGSSFTQAIPQDGRIRLDAGQAFEATLSFPRLTDEAQIGVLVYGNRVLPFSLWAKVAKVTKVTKVK